MQHQKSFRNLVVWQVSKELTLCIYKTTNRFPSEERYNLVSQLRRSSYSVMANIAEGNSKESIKEKIRFFSIAQASLTETDCGIELVSELDLIDQQKSKELNNLINRTGYLLRNLIKALRSSYS